MWQAVVVTTGGGTTRTDPDVPGRVQVLDGRRAATAAVVLQEDTDPLVLVAHRGDAAAARVLATYVAANQPGRLVAHAVTDHAPLAAVAALDLAASLGRDAGHGLSVWHDLLAAAWSGAVLRSVTRLGTPNPPMAMHVRSWLPGSRFLVRQGPDAAVVPAQRAGELVADVPRRAQDMLVSRADDETVRAVTVGRGPDERAHGGLPRGVAPRVRDRRGRPARAAAGPARGPRAPAGPLLRRLRPARLRARLRLLPYPHGPRGPTPARGRDPVNPRQRRGIVFMVLSVLVAVAVFVILTNYVRSVSSQVGPTTTVYRAAGPIDAYVPLDESNLEPYQVPERWAAPTARLDLPDLDGRRVGFALEAGTVVTSDMLVPPSDLSPTEREIAINVDAVTGVAGRVRTGDRVDLYAVFADVTGLPAQVRVLVRDVRIVSIGGVQTVTQSDDEGIEEADVIPVTLALEPDDSLAVTYANAFAEEVRLVALPTDTGLDRSEDIEQFDAGNLGGTAIPEGLEGLPDLEGLVP